MALSKKYTPQKYLDWTLNRDQIATILGTVIAGIQKQLIHLFSWSDVLEQNPGFYVKTTVI